MKEKVCGYIDLNKTELRKIHCAELYYADGTLFKMSSKSKRFIEYFCNKITKAKVYEVIVREVKK